MKDKKISAFKWSRKNKTYEKFKELYKSVD